MILGYARVSTTDQDAKLQIDALKKYGCTKIYTDKASGKNLDRENFISMQEHMREGDKIVVWRLDRLSRSLKDLIETVNYFEDCKVDFVSITENIDTTTPTGKLIFHIFGAFAEFERNLIRERTNAGLAASRARGVFGGRKFKLDVKQIATIKKMYDSKEHTVSQICELFKITKPTLYAALKK